MKLFEPGKISKLSLKNRIVMAPLGIGGLGISDLGGRLSQRGIDYYAARAKGGVGLIITGGTRVSREIEYSPDVPANLRIDNGTYIALSALSEFADAIHDYGAKAAIQLTPGQGRCARLGLIRSLGAVGPSALPCFSDPSIMTRELTIKEIERLVSAFGFAAEIMRNAGIDAVEINARGGYLLDEFMTSLWNKRTDKYGGDLDGRLRFLLEIIESIRKGAGADFPIIVKYCLTHYLAGGREINEGIKIARKLEAAGVDALGVSAGCYETMYWFIPTMHQPPGCMVDLAERVKQAVHIPVIAMGRLGNPDLAEQVLQEGKADFVAEGRALLADPDWSNKVREKRYEDIRPCIGCYKCMERLAQLKYLSCAVNPAAGMEREFTIKPAEKRKSVLVIGGGPGGMEAARIAALRGHKVSLLEKNNELGGSLIPGSVPHFKQEHRSLINYLSTQIKKLGVEIKLATEATPELIQEKKPEVVFIATGSTPIIPDIPGAEKKNVVTAIDLLSGKRQAGESVVVLGGGLVGCETALYLAQKGKKVTIVEILDSVMGDMHTALRQHMQKLFADTRVEILTGARCLEITDKGMAITHKGDNNSTLEADTIVLAVGLKPNNGLLDMLRDRVPEVYSIGDCVEPRKVIDAIWEGFRTARLV